MDVAPVFDVHFGEAFVIGFITVAVVSARYWPKLGEIIAMRLAKTSGSGSDRDAQRSDETPHGG